MLRHDPAGAVGAQLRLLHALVPRPRVAVPHGREHVERLGVRAGVRHLDRHQQVVRVGLGVVDLDDPVAVVVEGARVEQLVLGVVLAAAAVLGDEVAVGELALRVVVAPAVPGVARQRVEVPPVLLRVLAVVALAAGEAEDALLQDRVAAVPEREREAEPLLDVREPGQPVLAPAVGARAGLVVGEVVPRRPVPRCSPRGPCPTGARSGTAPSGTSRTRPGGRRPCCRTSRRAPAPLPPLTPSVGSRVIVAGPRRGTVVRWVMRPKRRLA